MVGINVCYIKYVYLKYYTIPSIPMRIPKISLFLGIRKDRLHGFWANNSARKG